MQRARRPNRQPRRGNQNADPNSTLHSNNTPRTFSPRRPQQPYVPVPSFSSIIPGSGVSIILKQDQPTGRQVQGVVAELLTRGDHPRGVKVRLRDGRVGRVQKVVAEEEGLKGEEAAGGQHASLGRNGEGAVAASAAPRGRGAGRRGGRGSFRHVQDVRTEGGEEYVWDESRSRNLGEYFAGLDLEDRKENEVVESKSDTVKCPVCGVFEGDERAVAHHVEGHFQDD